jgi:hypothetical protein
MRRKGRHKILDTGILSPTAVLYYDGTILVDYTYQLTDGDLVTNAITGAFSTAGSFLLIGLPFKFGTATLTLTGVAAANTTLSTFVSSNTSFGWTPAPLVSDGTAVGGFTMKQSGSLGMNCHVAVWDPQGSAVSVNDSGYIAPLYWLRIQTAAITAGVNISEIRCYLTDYDGTSLRSESQGMTEFVTRSGERLIVSTNDYPSRFYETTATYIPQSRVFYLDINRAQVKAIPIPPQFAQMASDISKPVSYVTFNGWLIGSTTNGYLWKWNGTNCSALEAMAGMDLQNNIVGANAYLPQTPRGTQLDVYRNRLMVTCDPTSPLAFYASTEDNNLTIIPTSATIGGPNVWPLKYAFRVPGRDGDAIIGASVINDSYVILTRTQIWIFDDTAIKLTNANIGCIASGSIQRVNNVIYFLSDTGPMVTDGVNAIPLMDKVWKMMREQITWTAIQGCTSAHDRTKGEYWLWLPINGETKNQMALVYNYNTGEYRVVAGWYLFDTDARRDANSVVHSVTASCEVIGSDGRRRLLTCDTSGIFWQEGTGQDDNGRLYPAYAIFRPISVNENYSSFADWFVSVKMDGQWLEAVQLPDGVRFDQEIDCRLSNVTGKADYCQKQALTSSSVATEPDNIYSSPPNWPVGQDINKEKKLRFSFRHHLTKMQPVLHWTPGGFNAGSYTGNMTSGRGAITDIQIVLVPRGAR